MPDLDMTVEQFVAQLYRWLLGREPEPGPQAVPYWSAKARADGHFADVITNISRSAEFAQMHPGLTASLHGAPTPDEVSPPNPTPHLMPWGALPLGAIPDTGPDNGIFGALPYYAGATDSPDEIVRVRYKARVTAPQLGPVTNFKICFAFHRLWGEAGMPYVIEANWYTLRILYQDGTANLDPADWNPKGIYDYTRSSLRLALTDFAHVLNLPPGKTGVKALAPSVFPRQLYLIDGQKGTTSVVCMSQIPLDGKDLWIDLSRGRLVDDKAGWLGGDTPLDGDIYRQWIVSVLIDGIVYRTVFAVPEKYGEYLWRSEFFYPKTEWFHTPGDWSVQFWDVEVQQEGSAAWLPVREWVVTDANRPDLRGIKVVVPVDEKRGMEFSQGKGIASGTRFTLS